MHNSDTICSRAGIAARPAGWLPATLAISRLPGEPEQHADVWISPCGLLAVQLENNGRQRLYSVCVIVNRRAWVLIPGRRGKRANYKPHTSRSIREAATTAGLMLAGRPDIVDALRVTDNNPDTMPASARGYVAELHNLIATPNAAHARAQGEA